MLLETKLTDPSLAPIRANPTDAGLDLKSAYDVTLTKGVRTLVGTGVHAKIPHNHVGFLFARSSLSKKNIILTNSVGVIDSDYRGEILASLMYLGSNETLSSDWITLTRGERIVQLVVVPIALPVPVYGEQDWFDTERGENGFGSTGAF
jgi:dUTP pyrophosphatase